jgi:hypothetical protein
VALPYSTSTVVSDGILLAGGISPEDQVEVYYGGRQLNKRGVYYHDSNLSYDSPEFNMIGNVASKYDLPKTTTLKDAYIDTSTNQIWVFTNSLSSSAVNGYEYKGMKYLPPEFAIEVTTATVLVTEMVNGGQVPTGSGWVFHETAETMQIQPGWIMQDANGARYTVTYSAHNTLFNGWGVGFANSITIAWPLTFIEPKIQQLTLNISDTPINNTNIMRICSS